MSSTGWAVVRFDFEKRWTEAHQAPKVHIHERARILAGDTRPIARDLEPAFAEGQEVVLSWSRQTRHAAYDNFGRLTGEVLVAPRLALFTITVREVKRHRLGGFRVHYDIIDCREATRLVRRKPPALRDGDYSEANEAEVAEAAIESAYTTNPKQALDHLEAVDDLTQRRFSRDSKDREAQAIGDLIAAMEDVRSALDERVRDNPEAAKIIGRELWQLRGRIDAAKSRLKRRMAA